MMSSDLDGALAPVGWEPEAYSVLCEEPNGDRPAWQLVDAWPRTAEGAIVAVNRAASLSRSTGQPHEVRLPDGRLLCRYVAGRRADLAPPL
jgi:hypothetical protein